MEVTTKAVMIHHCMLMLGMTKLAHWQVQMALRHTVIEGAFGLGKMGVMRILLVRAAVLPVPPFFLV
jgi:hypothetical protein